MVICVFYNKKKIGAVPSSAIKTNTVNRYVMVFVMELDKTLFSSEFVLQFIKKRINRVQH